MHATKKEMKDLDRLKKRSDFLRAAKSGKKWVSKGFILQVVENDTGRMRFGLTVSKRADKSAVVRNRIKRRLRAVAYEILPLYASEGFDYVLIGRRETADRSYWRIKKDLKWCLDKLGMARNRRA